MMRLQQALDWIACAQSPVTLVGDANVQITRVHTDTRTLQAGDLFVALKGERFDANDFLPQARKQGAVAAIALIRPSTNKARLITTSVFSAWTAW